MSRIAPRRAAPRGIKTGDLREIIENAFHAAGGRDYLVSVAKRRPDVFCNLLGKIIPSEVHMSVLAAYQAMPVPVEVRDPIPGHAPANALPGTFTGTGGDPTGTLDSLGDPVPAADDWLA